MDDESTYTPNPNSPPLNPDRLLSRTEVEAAFGIRKRFLEIAAGKGNGPAFIKMGRRTLYRVADLQAWIAANRYDNTTQVDHRKGDR